MKLIGTIIKLILSTLACVYIFHGDTIIYQIVLFALCYGLITYYAYCFREWKESGFEFDASVFEDGLFGGLLSIILTLCIPFITLLIPYWILGKIFGETIGGGIVIGIILVVCFGCLIVDIAEIIGVFKPDFSNSKKEHGKNAGSGYIEDDEQ